MKIAGLMIVVLLGGIAALVSQPTIQQKTYTKHEAFGIFRPVDDGTGLTKWEFVQDASHFGPLFLGEPYIEGNAVKADFTEAVNIFSGQLTHDGQLASFPPGLSINTTGISFSIWEMRKPVLLFQIRLNDGHVTSWTETPTGSTNFDTIVTTQNGNEFELFFVDHEYLNAPFVTEAPEGYTVKTVYPGKTLHPHIVRLKVFDSAGNPVTTLPNNFRVMIQRDVDMEEVRVRVHPTDPRLHQIQAPNYWFSGDFLSRD